MNGLQALVAIENRTAPSDSSPVKLKLKVHALSRDAQRSSVNWLVLGFMLLFHLGAIAALFFFSWSALAVAVALHVIAINVGIGMGYHRLLTHRGYQVPKWLEYSLAVCATLSLEGGPFVCSVEWLRFGIPAHRGTARLKRCHLPL